jgi:regulatory protein
MKITAITQQVKRTDRYSVFVDGVFAFGLSEGGLLQSGLASGQELDDARLRELKKMAGLDKAYNNALRYTAMRPRSEWEIRTYLERKGLDEPAARQIMQRLKRARLLDDADFARAWVAHRRQLKSTSKRKLRLELKQKHVPEDIINQVLSEDETTDKTALRELVAKKRARYPDQQKLMAYLARQGFTYDDIKSVISEE